MIKGLRHSLGTRIRGANGVALLLLSIAGSAHAIVRHHDVSDSKYLVKPQSVPGFVNLPYEGHGGLINPRWVVTAAHAVSSMRDHPKDWFVTINGRHRIVTRIVVYPDFDASTVGWKKLFKEMGSGDAAVWADGPWLRYVFDCNAAALPLEGVIAGGDSGGPVLISVNGKWTLAGLAHGLDGSIKDVLATRAGTFKSGICGQTFASTRVSFFAHWIADTISSASRISNDK
jgi:hypothetical protein